MNRFVKLLNMKQLCLYILVLLCFARSTFSNEILRFKALSTFDKFVKQNTVLADAKTDIHSLLATEIDLNNDGLPEMIVKDGANICSAHEKCQHIVFARKNTQWIEIGAFLAYNILVSEKTNYGIRDLLVYNNSVNEFDSVRFRWNPKLYKYEQTE